jgi:osmotically-inducible protein OsmY
MSIDAGVEARLRAALEHEPLVNLHTDRIEIEHADGVAVLSGEVASIAAKRLTLEIAAALPAVTGIVDRLHVRPAAPMGDGEIADQLERKLQSETALHECGLRRLVGQDLRTLRHPKTGRIEYWIEFRVEDGVVTLDGDVPSLSHKRLAGALAWWVPGSRDVVNGLGVEPDELDTSAEICDALRIVLEKDPLVDATQIHADCEGAVITLNGTVTADSARTAAEFDAWALFGVDKVVNRIEVVRS